MDVARARVLMESLDDVLTELQQLDMDSLPGGVVKDLVRRSHTIRAGWTRSSVSHEQLRTRRFVALRWCGDGGVVAA